MQPHALKRPRGKMLVAGNVAYDLDLHSCLASILEQENVAYDISAYRDAPPGLRIWGGATVETADIAALPAWLDWAYAEATR